MASTAWYTMITNEELDALLLQGSLEKQLEYNNNELYNKYSSDEARCYSIDCFWWSLHCIYTDFPIDYYPWQSETEKWDFTEKYGKYPLNLAHYGGYPIADNITSFADFIVAFYLRNPMVQDIAAALQAIDDAWIEKAVREKLYPNKTYRDLYQEPDDIEGFQQLHRHFTEFFQRGADEGRCLFRIIYI